MRATIEHRKTTAAEGRNALIVIGITVVFMVVGMSFFVSRLGCDSDKFFVAVFFTVMGVIASIGVCYAIVNIRANSTFVCEIDDEQIRCVSHVKLCGESFSILIRDIAKIERANEGEGSHCWYVWNKAGQRFWLTSNYNNPVNNFIDAIRERCPDVTEITT